MAKDLFVTKQLMMETAFEKTKLLDKALQSANSPNRINKQQLIEKGS